MDRIFILVVGICDKEQVVCFYSSQLFAHFKSALVYNPHISYQKLSVEDATKLLVEGNGIGVGCYAASGEADADAVRATRARKNKVEFAKKLNIPVFLHVERLETKPKERAILKLKH